MKYVVLAGALAFSLCAGVCEAEETKMQGASGQAAATGAKASCGVLKHIDLGDDHEESITTVGTMSQGQNYDGNTGFPNVVKSDGDMNLE